MALASRDRLIGAELGTRFAEVRVLRAGARFTVFEARELGANRAVVVKVPDDSRAAWLHDVLRSEAEILAATCAHPNIVTLYQQFVLADGRPALVLERCHGNLFDALHPDAPMPLPEAVACGIKLAGALETVHRAGAVHSDVRPRNVLISEWGEPVLTGFDEAVRPAGVADHPPLHRFTPHTAPELLEGADPSVAGDVYGLASTLYELVAGRAAFRAYVGESPASVVARVLSSTVAPIVRPDVPLELSDLLTWSLSPDPAERPPSPAWLAEELGRIEQHQGWPRTRFMAA